MRNFVIFAVSLFLCGLPALAQSDDMPRLGVGVTAGTLGVGVQAATSVTHSSNVRAGFNFFNYSDNLTKDGIDYSGTLRFRSVQATFDQYIWSGLHISPGLLIWNGTGASANASVPAGQPFSLGNVNYYSNSANPVTGAGTIGLNKVAPMILIGFGNMLPRNQRHFGLNFDAGVAFTGTPKANLNLSGTACVVSPAVGCIGTTNSIIQTNVTGEQGKINNNINGYKYYPVIALTFSYKF